jgi:hypothetical protein
VALGTVWESGSWESGAWADGTWADAVVPKYQPGTVWKEDSWAAVWVENCWADIALVEEEEIHSPTYMRYRKEEYEDETLEIIEILLGIGVL